jgi:hypothetical protein
VLKAKSLLNFPVVFNAYAAPACPKFHWSLPSKTRTSSIRMFWKIRAVPGNCAACNGVNIRGAFGPKIYFTPSGMTYQYDRYKVKDAEEIFKELYVPGKDEEYKEDILAELKDDRTTTFYRMTWEGANPNPSIISKDKQAITILGEM